jgi:hypothetical protein
MGMIPGALVRMTMQGFVDDWRWMDNSVEPTILGLLMFNHGKQASFPRGLTGGLSTSVKIP